MAYYSIGEVAERCGINPVTLRAWQRRYGLLKPQRSEGGHRQFDEEDVQRIEEIKGVNDGLKAQIAEASDSSTICYAAARDLGMVPASSAQAIHLTAVDTRPSTATPDVNVSADAQVMAEANANTTGGR